MVGHVKLGSAKRKVVSDKKRNEFELNYSVSAVDGTQNYWLRMLF